MKHILTSYRKNNEWWPLMLAVVSATVGLFLLIALGTFYPHDPSVIFATSDPVPLHNKAGAFGAHISAILVYLFGIAALLWIPFFWGVTYVALRYYDVRYHMDTLLAFLAGLVACAALACLFTLNFFSVFHSGGVVGSFAARLALYTMDLFVAKFFFSLLAFASLIVVSRLSVLYIFLFIGRAVRYVCSRRFMVPLWDYSSHVCKKSYHYVYTGATKVKDLLDGTYVHRRARSVVSFEFEDIVRKEFEDTLKSPVFNYHKQQTVSLATESNQEEFTASLYEQEATNYEEGTTVFDNSTEQETDYRLPKVNQFAQQTPTQQEKMQQDLDQERASLLEEKLARFGIAGKVVSIKTGPVVTLFEYQPEIDTKISKILALEDDLALALQAMSIRIIAPIPGRSVVGFEVANKHRSSVMLSSLIHSQAFTRFDGYLPIVLGVDTIGEPVIVDLMTMPHLLVAGATGSGKSVGLNTMLVSLLYKLKPSQMRLILVDPKRLEFASYSDIAHLLFPIVTHMKDVVPILRWVVQTMEERYSTMAEVGVRHVLDYQEKAAQEIDLEPMPFIVVMIDEFSDLMMTTGKDVEELIARIAQMARAAGIHMIIATQRPSVDVITGLIKVNFPSRVAFRVTSKVDSRTILDTGGAEKLLGKGDLLFLHAHAQLARAHGAYISDQEIRDLVTYIREQQPVQYLDIQKVAPPIEDVVQDEDGELFKQVCEFLQTVDEVSISLLQRKFRIGYNRSARIIERLEMHGMILSSDGSKMRKVVHSG